jgi:hypothetical protein
MALPPWDLMSCNASVADWSASNGGNGGFSPWGSPAGMVLSKT